MSIIWTVWTNPFRNRVENKRDQKLQCRWSIMSTKPRPQWQISIFFRRWRTFDPLSTWTKWREDTSTPSKTSSYKMTYHNSSPWSYTVVYYVGGNMRRSQGQYHIHWGTWEWLWCSNNFPFPLQFGLIPRCHFHSHFSLSFTKWPYTFLGDMILNAMRWMWLLLEWKVCVHGKSQCANWSQIMLYIQIDYCYVYCSVAFQFLFPRCSFSFHSLWLNAWECVLFLFLFADVDYHHTDCIPYIWFTVHFVCESFSFCNKLQCTVHQNPLQCPQPTLQAVCAL